MTPLAWHRAVVVHRNRRRLMDGFNRGMLVSGIVCALLALALWSFEFMFLGILLVVLQLFWCLALYALIFNWRGEEDLEARGIVVRNWPLAVGYTFSFVLLAAFSLVTSLMALYWIMVRYA